MKFTSWVSLYFDRRVLPFVYVGVPRFKRLCSVCLFTPHSLAATLIFPPFFTFLTALSHSSLLLFSLWNRIVTRYIAIIFHKWSIIELRFIAITLISNDCIYTCSRNNETILLYEYWKPFPINPQLIKKNNTCSTMLSLWFYNTDSVLIGPAH